MSTYYFTYGSEGHPFHGGWTEIEAPSRDVACAVFRSFHPDKMEGLLNCCSVYSEESFKKTCMSGHTGNMHSLCHEIIRVSVERHDGTSEADEETTLPIHAPTPMERARASVYATGNKWAIENFEATH